jgi:glycosyltransferase EpsH
MNQPLVSLIVPIYNVEMYLERCLDSILNQTYNNIEVICVNDGSPDNSQVIVDKLKIDNRLVSIIQANQGLSAARNTGLSKVSGDYVMFVDSDDWLYRNCVDKVVKQCLKYDLDALAFPYTKVFENRKEKQLVYKESQLYCNNNEFIDGFYKDMLGPTRQLLAFPHILDSRVTAHSKIYKTSLIDSITFTDTKKVGTEDLLFNVQALASVDKFMYFDEELYFYNKCNEGSLTSTYKERLINQWDNLHFQIEGLISKNPSLLSVLSNRYSCSILGLGLNVMCARKKFNWSRKEINLILSLPKYSLALQQLPLDNMPLHWKILFFCAKNKLATPLTLLLLIIHRVILK